MTSAQRDGLKDAALALTEPMIDDLVKDISHRIRDAGAITDTAEYQIYRAQALGASKKEVERRVAEQLNLQDEVISSLFEYVLDKSLAFEDNGSLQQMANAYAEMTKSKTAEMLQNLWGTTPDGRVLPLQDAYARALDFAFRETATGVLDMDTAIRRAVTPLARRGLRTIEQKSGRSIGVEYACRRYIMDQRVLCELYGGVICRPKSTSASPCAAARPMTSSRSFPPPWCRYTTLPVSDGDC